MSVRTKIQHETKRKGPPRNLGRGEIAFNEVDGLLYIGAGGENRGQARHKIAIAGMSLEESQTLTADEIKKLLRIEGDAVGTENHQDIHNKTLNGGFF